MKLMRTAKAATLVPARVRYAALSYAALGCALTSVAVGALVVRPKPVTLPQPAAPLIIEAPQPAATMPAAIPTASLPPVTLLQEFRSAEHSRQVLLEAPKPVLVKRAAPPPPAPTPPPPAPTPPPTPTTATVTISDRGFAPDKVAIKVGGSILFVNEGSTVHTATSIGPVRPFDTGGLANRQNARATLVVPGTYAYSSAPDCLNGNHNRQFDCAGQFSVTVIAG